MIKYQKGFGGLATKSFMLVFFNLLINPIKTRRLSSIQ